MCVASRGYLWLPCLEQHQSKTIGRYQDLGGRHRTISSGSLSITQRTARAIACFKTNKTQQIKSQHLLGGPWWRTPLIQDPSKVFIGAVGGYPTRTEAKRRNPCVPRSLLRCGQGHQTCQELGRRKVIGTTQLQGLK